MEQKVKVYAKLNLTLDVLGKEGGYHSLQSLCVSVDLCDEILLKKRTDNLIVLSCPSLAIAPQKNNAYRAAELFRQTFSTTGVDIQIKKGIPVCGGMGGSTADIVGVIKGMQRMFGVVSSVTPLINSLSSDGAFMERGGCGVLKGRGERVEFLSCPPLYFVLVPFIEGVSTAECFALSDKSEKGALGTENALRALQNWKQTSVLSSPICQQNAQEQSQKDAVSEKESASFYEKLRAFTRCFGNDLLQSATELLPCLKGGMIALQSTNPLALSMTGSGSTLYGVYPTKRSAELAKEKIEEQYPSAVVATTLPCGIEFCP